MRSELVESGASIGTRLNNLYRKDVDKVVSAWGEPWVFPQTGQGATNRFIRGIFTNAYVEKEYDEAEVSSVEPELTLEVAQADYDLIGFGVGARCRAYTQAERDAFLAGTPVPEGTDVGPWYRVEQILPDSFGAVTLVLKKEAPGG